MPLCERPAGCPDRACPAFGPDTSEQVADGWGAEPSLDDAQRRATGRTCAWLQAFAACRQKSRIRAGGVGPASSSWLSKMVTAPVDAVMCAAVPVPPTQP